MKIDQLIRKLESQSQLVHCLQPITVLQRVVDAISLCCCYLEDYNWAVSKRSWSSYIIL